MPKRPQRPPTPALDELRRLKELAARGEFIEPKPPGIDNARLLPPGPDSAPTALHEWSVELRQAERWFKVLAEGATWSEMQRAWLSWKPATPHVKEQLRSTYDAAELPCRRREADLHRAADAERQPWRAHARARALITEARRSVAKLEAELAKHQANLEAAQAWLERLNDEWDLSKQPDAA